MKLNWQSWIYGLLAALIGGGAGAVTAGFSAMMLTPGQYGVGGQAGWNSLKLMGLTFLISGAFAAFAYLKQSPLPTVVTTTQTALSPSSVITTTTSVSPPDPPKT